MNKNRRFLHNRLARSVFSIAVAAFAWPVTVGDACEACGGEISSLPPVQRIASRPSHWGYDRLFEPPLLSARRDEIRASSWTPDELDRPLLAFDPLEQASEIADPPGSKPGVFQTIRASETFLPQPKFGDLGLNEWELSATFGFPLPTRQSPLLITPGFEQTLFDGPTVADLPSDVYDVTVQFLWMHQLTERWGMQLGVTPGIHSDFERSDSDSLRFTARTVGVFEWREDLKLVLGVVFLDRNDVNWLPAAGIIWTPHDAVRWELVAPRPRIAWRFACDDCIEQWAYVAGEFGGGQWSIVRTGGAADVATYRDFRVFAGLERKPLSAYGLHLTFEFGYVFARQLEYASITPDVELDDTTMVRLTLSY